MEPLTGNIVHMIEDSCVNWSVKILDQFEWLTANVGQTSLVENEDDLAEGCCRCRIRKGEKCDGDCEMRKVNAECALWAHLSCNCGNKRIQLFLKHGGISPVYLDQFEGMGLGLRALRDVTSDEVIGVYWGRIGPARKTQRRKKGHSYVAEISEGVWVDAATAGSLMRYVNSSCEPNLRMEVWDIGSTKVVVYVSMRNIAKHEDLTTSYNDPLWVGECLSLIHI